MVGGPQCEAQKKNLSEVWCNLLPLNPALRVFPIIWASQLVVLPRCFQSWQKEWWNSCCQAGEDTRGVSSKIHGRRVRRTWDKVSLSRLDLPKAVIAQTHVLFPERILSDFFGFFCLSLSRSGRNDVHRYMLMGVWVNRDGSRWQIWESQNVSWTFPLFSKFETLMESE